MENNSTRRIDVTNAENSHELPKAGLITRMGRWFRKKYLAVAFAGGTALAAEGCVFDTRGLYLPERDAIADARPNDDSSIDAGDASVYNDGGDGSTTPDGGDGSTTPDAGDGTVVTPDAGPDAQVTTEICSDGIDNDGNGLTDCEDVAACNGIPSGPGAVCGPDGLEHETNCADGSDNDHDGFPNCADTDCDGESCGAGCTCIGGIKTEDASFCGDGIDNDNDGNTDCMDSNCTGEPCGLECECGGDGFKHQTVCDIGTDGDGDGWEGCVDLDCQTNARCTAFTRSCSLIPTGNTCLMQNDQLGYCAEYDICVDG